jgi:hypothetical protein
MRNMLLLLCGAIPRLLSRTGHVLLWQSGPFFSLRHQLRLLEIRCLAYQQEIPTLRAAALQLDDLKAQLAGFEKEFADLRQQVIQVEDLKAEISEL